MKYRDIKQWNSIKFYEKKFILITQTIFFYRAC